ncbi:ECF transporter S component [Fredinandcohnia sp. QZ13]|uniref:ECF transporter S component n=1 Tax=Fredinandcohnia sp. QZ13 TaxID=3073144 RepID=UPI0028534CF7|nr:ECF transporter S component [Fredinandcohnia sp. QZ13]MDR4888760.1 ECF transporter S component [Fredinandcohnia sp. QZ13]
MGIMNLSVKNLTFLSMLIALSVVGRIMFTFLPNVQPTTAIIIIASLFLGPIYGVIVAVLSSVLSNLVMGMGLWTVGQIFAWGIIGLISGALRKYRDRIPVVVLVIYAVFCGFLFGLVISIPLYLFSGKFFAYYIAGLPFDMSHAIGNGVFFLILYPILRLLFLKNVTIAK